eukprot:403334672
MKNSFSIGQLRNLDIMMAALSRLQITQEISCKNYENIERFQETHMRKLKAPPDVDPSDYWKYYWKHKYESKHNTNNRNRNKRSSRNLQSIDLNYGSLPVPLMQNPLNYYMPMQQQGFNPLLAGGMRFMAPGMPYGQSYPYYPHPLNPLPLGFMPPQVQLPLAHPVGYVQNPPLIINAVIKNQISQKYQ